MMGTRDLVLPLALLGGMALTGCRGDLSRQAPIHLNPNMDQQTRIDPQEGHLFFGVNGAPAGASRPWVPGTIPVGGLRLDAHLYEGRSGKGFARTLPKADPKARPIALDARFVQRGQDRYGIYCRPCHDGAGTGKGIMVERGMLPPPSFHDPRILGMPVGQIYNVIANGVRNMPAYRAQIPVMDRWAIATYVRALQLSRSAKLEQVPPDEAAKKRWEIR